MGSIVSHDDPSDTAKGPVGGSERRLPTRSGSGRRSPGGEVGDRDVYWVFSPCYPYVYLSKWEETETRRGLIIIDCN